MSRLICTFLIFLSTRSKLLAFSFEGYSKKALIPWQIMNFPLKFKFPLNRVQPEYSWKSSQKRSISFSGINSFIALFKSFSISRSKPNPNAPSLRFQRSMAVSCKSTDPQNRQKAYNQVTVFVIDSQIARRQGKIGSFRCL